MERIDELQLVDSRPDARSNRARVTTSLTRAPTHPRSAAQLRTEAGGERRPNREPRVERIDELQLVDSRPDARSNRARVTTSLTRAPTHPRSAAQLRTEAGGERRPNREPRVERIDELQLVDSRPDARSNRARVTTSLTRAPTHPRSAAQLRTEAGGERRPNREPRVERIDELQLVDSRPDARSNRARVTTSLTRAPTHPRSAAQLRTEAGGERRPKREPRVEHHGHAQACPCCDRTRVRIAPGSPPHSRAHLRIREARPSFGQKLGASGDRRGSREWSIMDMRKHVRAATGRAFESRLWSPRPTFDPATHESTPSPREQPPEEAPLGRCAVRPRRDGRHRLVGVGVRVDRLARDRPRPEETSMVVDVDRVVDGLARIG